MFQIYPELDIFEYLNTQVGYFFGVGSIWQEIIVAYETEVGIPFGSLDWSNLNPRKDPRICVVTSALEEKKKPKKIGPKCINHVIIYSFLVWRDWPTGVMIDVAAHQIVSFGLCIFCFLVKFSVGYLYITCNNCRREKTIVLEGSAHPLLRDKIHPPSGIDVIPRINENNTVPRSQAVIFPRKMMAVKQH